MQLYSPIEEALTSPLPYQKNWKEDICADERYYAIRTNIIRGIVWIRLTRNRNDWQVLLSILLNVWEML